MDQSQSLPYRALSLGLYFYVFVYAFEAPIRFLLDKLHASEAIFLRDAAIFVPLAVIFASQVMRREVQGAFLAYVFVIGLHGSIILLNFHNPLPALYGAKLCLGILAGAVAQPVFFQPEGKKLWFFALLWIATVAGVVLDKYLVDFPWFATHTIIGGMEVDISRDWQINGAAKRAGGFTRASINAAFLAPLLSYTLLFRLRGVPVRALIVALTTATLYMTTQKGGLLAYIISIAALMAWPIGPIRGLKVTLVLMMLACILLPVVLPHFTMPHSEGMFSMATFYQRVEEMWPEGWGWIDRHDLFPFGVGLGGIGGAQRFYAPSEITYADNLFILMYAFFGVMSFLYLGWIAVKALQVPVASSPMGRQALTILVFLFAYGCVLSLLEDQMAALFLGAALGAMGREISAHHALKEAHG